MDNDNQLQKIPEYSVSKIIRKSNLATRGLRELGLLKNKKHFTIIYVCQFCGKLINSALIPCIYCGKLPKTKKEIVIAQALSSESMSIGDQLQALCWIKEGRDLEIEIHDLREFIDRVTSDWKSYPVYDAQFKIAKDSAMNCKNTDEKIQQILTLSKAQCPHCGKNVPYLCDKCPSCYKDLSELQKLVLVIKQILDFIEIFLDGGGDDESIEELIFILVHTINRAVEKEEYPNQELLKRMYELFHKSHYLISYRRGVGIEIKNGEAYRIGGSGGEWAQTKDDWLSVLLAMNVDYLLQQCKQQNAEEKALGPLGG